MTIEVTDEMVQLIYDRIDFWDHSPDGISEGLAAVLAIVERDLGLVGPCSSVLSAFAGGGRSYWCELRHGHAGDHENGITRWKAA